MTADLRRLPVPEPGRAAAASFVAAHFDDLYLEREVVSSPRFRGGQVAADAALERFDVTGYAKRRNEAFPETRRGASRLSPYIRHGLLDLPRVWSHVESGPEPDVAKFRDELLWQEYARHWYARLGPRTAAPTRRRYPAPVDGDGDGDGWDRDMACLELTIDELEDDGWLVNQTRMWLASHWTVRNGHDWRVGEDHFFRHLLDGSRAANRLGWQWTTGVGANKVYGFSRWQVEKRAPGLCASCDVAARCPIIDWPTEPDLERLDPEPALRQAVDGRRAAEAGPVAVERHGDPEAVWLTAESLGDADPALAAQPDLPARFVFDRPLLARLSLSSKRLVFLVESLAELAERRPVDFFVGDPAALGGRLAATFAPVPGWRRHTRSLDVVEVHPWPWLRRPNGGNVSSFRAWLGEIQP